jgi:hypothetical protein
MPPIYPRPGLAEDGLGRIALDGEGAYSLGLARIFGRSRMGLDGAVEERVDASLTGQQVEASSDFAEQGLAASTPAPLLGSLARPITQAGGFVLPLLALV